MIITERPPGMLLQYIKKWSEWNLKCVTMFSSQVTFFGMWHCFDFLWVFRVYGPRKSSASRWRRGAFRHHHFHPAEAAGCCCHGDLTGSWETRTRPDCPLCCSSATVDRCLFIWELLLFLHAHSNIFHTCSLLLQVGELVEEWIQTKNHVFFFYLHLFYQPYFCLQNGLSISLFFFVLIPHGQHFPDEKQEKCKYIFFTSVHL